MLYITSGRVKQLGPTLKYKRHVGVEIVPWFSCCIRNSVASGYCLIDPVLVRHYKGGHEETKSQSHTIHIDRLPDINQSPTGAMFSSLSFLHLWALTFIRTKITFQNKNKKLHHNITFEVSFFSEHIPWCSPSPVTRRQEAAGSERVESVWRLSPCWPAPDWAPSKKPLWR